jgi:hypothetical protein
MVNPDSGSTPFQYAVEHVGLVGWPAVCWLFYWIGKTLQQGIAEYKEDRAIIRETKEVVDVKTDKALVIMGETKATVDTMLNNHMHTLETKVDSLSDSTNVKMDRLVNVLGDIKENTAVMAALLKDRQA